MQGSAARRLRPKTVLVPALAKPVSAHAFDEPRSGPNPNLLALLGGGAAVMLVLLVGAGIAVSLARQRHTEPTGVSSGGTTEQKRAVEVIMRPLGNQLQSGLSDLISSALAQNDYMIAAYAGLAQEDLLRTRMNTNLFVASPGV